MNKIIKLKIILLLCLSIAAPAAAADFIFNGSIDETFNDNTNLSATEPESDWITNMALGLGIRSEGRQLSFDFIGNVYQQIYAKQRDESANSQDLTLMLNFDFSENISLALNNVFQHYPDSRSYSVLFGRGGEDTGYIRNNFSSALSFNLTRQLFFDLTYNNMILRNDSDALADSVQHNPGMDIGYSINSSNIIRIGYMKFIMIYDNGEKQKEDRGYAEYELHFTEQLRTILHGGCDYINSGEDISLNARWQASVIDDIDKRNQLNITYLKERTISDVAEDTFNNWTVTGTLSREISLRTGFGLSLFYGSAAYEMSGAVNKLAGASIRLDFILTDFVNLNAGYTYTWNKSTAPGDFENKYDRNTIFAGLSAKY